MIGSSAHLLTGRRRRLAGDERGVALIIVLSVVAMLTIGSLLIVASSSPFVAPFIYYYALLTGR